MELENSCNNKTVGTQTSFVKNSVKEENSNLTPNASEQDTAEKVDEVQAKHKLETDCLDAIRNVLDSMDELRQQIENFSGTSMDDRDYKYLDEMMIRGLVTLDELQSNGNMVVKQERKRAVQYIQKLMRVLDVKLRENREALQELVDSEDEI